MNSLEAAVKQILRAEILRISQAAGEAGAGVELLTAVLKKADSGITRAMVQEQAEYLAGKGLLSRKEVQNRALSISRIIYRITPEGTDCLEGTLEAPGIELG